MKRLSIFFLIAASLLTGCVIVDPPAIVALDDYQVKDNGKVIELTLSVSSDTRYVIFYCSGRTPFDTLSVEGNVPEDGRIIYDIDSTFLFACKHHDEIRIGTEEGVEAALYLGYSVVSNSSHLVLYGKDTLFFSGDTVRTSEYIKVQKYSGGLYAPLPPEGYDTLLIAGSHDTLIVWQDYDHDGVSGYDGDDIFWVVLVGSDGARAITLNRRDNLTGYRGLDLCFKCMEGKR